MTVARVEKSLPSTAPGFVHVILDSSGSYKDVPMDQLYSFRLDPNITGSAEVAEDLEENPTIAGFLSLHNSARIRS